MPKRGWLAAKGGGELVRFDTPLEALRYGIEMLGGSIRFRNLHGDAVDDARTASRAYIEACGEERTFSLLGLRGKGPTDVIAWLEKYDILIQREPSNGHGGARSGAGRKPGGKNRTTSWGRKAAEALRDIYGCGDEGAAALMELARHLRGKGRKASREDALRLLRKASRSIGEAEEEKSNV